MKSFFLIFIFVCQALAAPPIEGGRLAPIADLKYIDIVKLKQGMRGPTCTGTRVAQNLVLTAAHCVVDSKNGFKNQYRIGGPIGIYGVVKAIHPHPKYRDAIEAAEVFKEKSKEAWKDPNNRPGIRSQLDNIRAPATQHDIAFIEFEKRETKRKLPYPKIIDAETRFHSRGKVSLAGYGTTGISWSGNNFAFDNGSDDLRIGGNSWTCSFDDKSSGLEEIEALAGHVGQALSIESQRIHVIENGQETILNHDGTAMVMAGDSGSPALEEDIQGEMVVTAVASNISPYEEGSGNAAVEIFKDGKRHKVVFAEFPKDWGNKHKSDSQFEEINVELKKLGLVDADGAVDPDVEIRRTYKRVTVGNFADLSHPDNQSFIREIFSKTK